MRDDLLDIGICQVYILYMDFEFDATKSGSNKAKHGIDFVEAQSLWNDPDLVEIPVRTTDERRFMIVGRIAKRHGSAVITYRGDRIRIISVRRARHEEIDIYEGS
ncbi:BrnT family toxin [Anaerobaca lacustris]|uniref:BrnT family toxin n=1 Tax=Anaerobaca lacustris TaxID=3044600 RepID=A0AAW6TSX8_9BACT|nr:BrnT family toxin [Sedimentisphaerales bacterium M17dextr]